MNKGRLFLLLIAISAPASAAQNYGIFENDQVAGTRVEEIKKATVSIIKNEKLMSKSLYKLGEQYRFCVKENFEEQRLWSNCSGILISKNVVLTAGHCVLSNADCKNLNFVFDFNTDAEIDKIQLDKSRIFKCNRLLYSSKPVPSQQLIDYALVQLDRDVPNVSPIQLSTGQLDEHSEDIMSVGHPLGLPKKILKGFVDSADISNKNINFYKSHMPAYAGLSGSGVYNSSFDLVGVLVRGDAPMEPDDGRCYRVRSCDQQLCPWSEIQKLDITNIKKYLK